VPRLIISPSAEADLGGILDHISQDKLGAAQRFVAKLRETCKTLGENPHLGAVWPQIGDGMWRAFAFQKYVIFYRTSDDLVEILRVVHGARDLERLFR